MTGSQHVYEIRPREDKRGFDLISDGYHLVACGMATQMQSANAIGYALARLIRAGLW